VFPKTPIMIPPTKSNIRSYIVSSRSTCICVPRNWSDRNSDISQTAPIAIVKITTKKAIRYLFSLISVYWSKITAATNPKAATVMEEMRCAALS